MNRIIKAFCAVLALTVLIVPQVKPEASASVDLSQIEANDTPYKYVPGRVLVKYRERIARRPGRELAMAVGAHAEEIPNTGIEIIELPEGTDEKIFMRMMMAQADVEFAELDRLVAPDDMIPNDPNYQQQWHLPVISTPAAWTTTSGSSNVIIAIIDTGVDSTHPDLSPKMVPGWNFYDNSPDSNDVYGHGTAVAGTAAAASNNNLGVASVAWGCQIMPIRISDPNGYGSLSAMANALTWAADHGARVANISYPVTDSLTVADAAQYFQSRGGAVTISSGNDHSFDPIGDNPHVLTVGATGSNDALASFSTRGNNLDITAPGVGIQTTCRGGSYGPWSGTSFSAPVVAGVAALVISANPYLTAADVQMVLKQSADDLGSAGWDPSFGWGRINAARAVEFALNTSVGGDNAPPTVNITSHAWGASVSRTITLQAAASDNAAITVVRFSLNGIEVGADTNAPYAVSLDTTTLADGTYNLSATATDSSYNNASAVIELRVSNALGTIAPVVIITSPTEGAIVYKNLSVYVHATDDIAVEKVELYVDGVLQDSSRRVPFTTRWNTNKEATGTHTLQCRAYDREGNVGISPAVAVYK